MPDRAAKSVGHETTFDCDTEDLAKLEQTVREFLAQLTHDLRLEGLAASSFRVKLKDRSFKVTTRQRQFPKPLNQDSPMWQEIQAALRSLARPRIQYRLVGLSLGDLVPAAPTLFDTRTDQAPAAMDAIIERHGPESIRIGSLPKDREGRG